jgi:hypothetical protein
MCSEKERLIENFMLPDIESCLQNCVKTGYGSFVLALALSAYTEALGGLVRGRLGVSGESERNYRAFLERMNYSSEESGEYYDKVRCGLVHQYLAKGQSSVGSLGNKKGIEKREGTIHFDIFVYYDELKRAYNSSKSEIKVQFEQELTRNYFPIDSKIPSSTIASSSATVDVFSLERTTEDP